MPWLELLDRLLLLVPGESVPGESISVTFGHLRRTNDDRIVPSGRTKVRMQSAQFC